MIQGAWSISVECNNNKLTTLPLCSPSYQSQLSWVNEPMMASLINFKVSQWIWGRKAKAASRIPVIYVATLLREAVSVPQCGAYARASFKVLGRGATNNMRVEEVEKYQPWLDTKAKGNIHDPGDYLTGGDENDTSLLYPFSPKPIIPVGS